MTAVAEIFCLQGPRSTSELALADPRGDGEERAVIALPCSPSLLPLSSPHHPSTFPFLSLPHIYLNLLSREENLVSVHLKPFKYLSVCLFVCRCNCICHCRKASAIARKYLLIDPERLPILASPIAQIENTSPALRLWHFDFQLPLQNYLYRHHT